MTDSSTAPDPASTYRRRAVLLLAAMVCFLIPFLRTLWRIGDEGSIVYGAQRVAEGATPYRDFFEVMGPGAFYWLAAWFKAFGTSWLTSRITILLTAVVAAAALLGLSGRIIRGSAALLPAIIYTALTIPLWPGANHHFDSNAWALAGLALFATAEPAPRWRTALSAVLVGVAATVIPQKGVLIMLAMLSSTWWHHWRRGNWKTSLHASAWLLVPFAGVGTLVVLTFWAHGALTDLVYAMAIWPATQYHSVNVVPYAYGLRELYLASWAPGLNAVFRWPVSVIVTCALAVPLLFVATLPAFYLFCAVRYFFARARAVALTSAVAAPVPPIFWTAGPALLLSEFHRPDIKHLVYGSPLLLVVVLRWLSADEPRFGRAVVRALTACTATFAIFMLLLALRPGTQIDTRAGTVHVFEKDEALEFLDREVDRKEPVFVYPYYPMYYFLADVKNPTRYSILMYHINTGSQFEESIAALQGQCVRYILWDTFVSGESLTLWFPGYQDPPAESQALDRYMQANYEQVALKSGFRILRRRATAPCSLPSATSDR